MSSAPKIPSAEFLALTEKYLEGTLSPEELARWEKRCLEDPDALAYYLSLARAEVLLPEALARAEAEGKTANVIPFYRRPAFAGASAACVALAVLAGVASRLRPDAAVATGVPARVTNAVGVRWTEGASEAGERLSLPSGAISSGLLELTLDSGVRLLIQGPAAWSVTGPNAVRLESGRAVADVPSPARGFTLTSHGDRIVDHGTRFAVEVRSDGSETTLGVLSGEVELFNGAGDVRLFTDYAVRRDGDAIRSVPFDKSRFVTEVPTREFSWSLDGEKHDVERTFLYDVTNLVHGPGDYRAVVRWLLGFDAITVNAFRLERDGVPVARAGFARSGVIEKTRDNLPSLHVSESDYRPGRWTLVMEAFAEGRQVSPPRPVNSAGVISFEEGLSLTAGASRFVGRWHYSHDGKDCVREFLPGGTARFYEKGVLTRQFDRAKWTVKDGVLTLDLGKAGETPETHMLRDNGTLVFLNRPYRNAYRE